MATEKLEAGEIYALNVLTAAANTAHDEYMRRLDALSAFRALVELKYKGELNMETGVIRKVDSPT